MIATSLIIIAYALGVIAATVAFGLAMLNPMHNPTMEQFIISVQLFLAALVALTWGTVAMLL